MENKRRDDRRGRWGGIRSTERRFLPGRGAPSARIALLPAIALVGLFMSPAVLCPPPAEALSDARFIERVASTFGTDPNFPEHIVVSVPGFYGEATTTGVGAVLPGGGPPSVEAIIDIGAGSGLSGIADARITYYFGVVGPPLPGGFNAVPVIIHAMLLVEVDPDGTSSYWIPSAFARVEVGLEGVFSDDATLQACSTLTGCFDRTWNPSFHVGMPLGPEGWIYLEASVWGRSSVRVRAVADPHIYIDPAFPYADLYRIETSDGVSNFAPPSPPGGAPVPEPGTWLLLGAGLAGLVLLRRKVTA